MQQIAKTSEISDGSMKAFDVAGERIAVANLSGRFFAFEDTCTHQHCELSQGELEDMNVVCPCHGGTFDIETGEVKQGPPTEPIRVYPVTVSDDTISVQI